MIRCLGACLLLGACATAGAPPPDAIAPVIAVAREVIGDNCRRAASREFGLPWGDLHVGEIEEENGRFHAVGQYPAAGAARMRFDCLYDGEGRFEAVRRL